MRNLDSFSKIIQGIQSFGRCRQQGMSVKEFKNNIANRVITGTNIDYSKIGAGDITEKEYYTILEVLGIKNSDVFKPSIEIPKIEELMKAVDYISSKVPIESIGTSEAEARIGKIIQAMRKKKFIRDSVADHLITLYGIGAVEENKIPGRFNLEEWVRPRIKYFGGFKINGVNVTIALQNPEIVNIINSRKYIDIQKLNGVYKELPAKCPKSNDNGKDIIPVAEPFSGQTVYIYVQAKLDGRLKWLRGELKDGLATFKDGEKFIDSEDSIVQVRVGYELSSRGGQFDLYTDSILANGSNPEIVPIDAESMNNFDIGENIGAQKLNLYQKCEQAILMITAIAMRCGKPKEGDSKLNFESTKHGEGTKVKIPIEIKPLDREWELNDNKLLRHISQNRGSVNSAKSALRGASIAIKNLDKNGSDELVSTDSDILNKKRARGIVDDLKSLFS